MTVQLKIGSLFSGYGGLDQAVESVTGARTAWVSDIDKGACKILAHRYPDVPNLGDLTQIDWTEVEPVDVITGGFPCQDLSHAGKRAGMADGTRSGLWSYMCEAINIIRPRLVVAENVRGLLSAEALRPVEPCTWCVGDEPRLDLRALGAVLADLADIGYDASWYGLRAADIGACHGRFRVFLVAYPRSEVGNIGAGLRTDESTGNGRRQSARSGGPTLLPSPRATDGTHGGPNQRGSKGDLMLPSAVVQLLPTPMAQEPGGTAEQYRACWKKSDGRDSTFLPLTHAVSLLPTPDASPEKYRLRGDSQQSRGLVALGATGHDFGQYAAAIARWESVIGRPAPSPTEPTGKNGAHRLSPAFTEWMMGLPAGWITDVPGITRNEALKVCGNGVVPQQAEAALRLLLTTKEAAA